MWEFQTAASQRSSNESTLNWTVSEVCRWSRGEQDSVRHTATCLAENLQGNWKHADVLGSVELIHLSSLQIIHERAVSCDRWSSGLLVPECQQLQLMMDSIQEPRSCRMWIMCRLLLRVRRSVLVCSGQDPDPLPASCCPLSSLCIQTIRKLFFSESKKRVVITKHGGWKQTFLLFPSLLSSLRHCTSDQLSALFKHNVKQLFGAREHTNATAKCENPRSTWMQQRQCLIVTSGKKMAAARI